MNLRTNVSWQAVCRIYKKCFSIKEMKKQMGGRMMKTFKHKKKKTENYESLVSRAWNVNM